MSDHIRIRNKDEKQFKRSFCQVEFSQICKLNVHLRMHSGEKPFKCETCQLTFTQNGSFQRHKLIHTDGNKPNTLKKP